MPKPSWLEKILRPAIIYLFLLAAFRFGSKRELAQATLFDFLILLLISNVVQNAIIGDDNSVGGALAGTLMLLALTSVLSRLTARSKKARQKLEGKPELLVRDGVPDRERMRRDAVSENDLFTAVRKQGLTRLSDVGWAILELDGTISIIKKDDDKGPRDCLPEEIVGGESGESKDGKQG